MRSASVDNRSRSIWLLAGLGVLIWAAFSVFFSGSSAHAEETPAPPSHQSQQQAAPEAPRAIAAATESVAAPPAAAPEPVASAPQRIAPAAAPQPIAAAPQPVAAQTPVATKTAVAAVESSVQTAAEQRPQARSLSPQVKAAVTQLADQSRQNHQSDRRRDESRADRHVDRSPHPRAGHAEHLPAQAIAAQSRHAHLDARSPEGAAQAHTAAPAAATATMTAAAASADAPAHFPFDSRGTSSQHQPAAPSSVSSAAGGASAFPGIVPGAVHESDLLGPLLTALHADDDVLPSGPAGTTDSSPD